MTDSFKEEMLSDFILESREHLGEVEPNLLDIEQHLESYSEEAINQVFRAIHSLKSSSAFFGFNKLKELSHVMENLLMQIRDGLVPIDEEKIDALIKGTDKLKTMIDDLQNAENVDTTENLVFFQQFLDGKKPAPKPKVKRKPKKVAKPKKIKKVTAKKPKADIPDAVKVMKIDGSHIEELIGKGNKFYTIQLSLARDIYARDKKPEDIRKLLASLGTIIGYDPKFEQAPDQSHPKAENVVISFLLSTVLEQDHLQIGLELEDNKINRIDKDTLNRAIELSAKEPIDFNSSVNPDAMATLKVESEKIAIEKGSDVKSSEVVETLRVPVPILNKLMDLAGELVLNRNQLKQFGENHSEKLNGLAPIVQSVDIITGDLQETIMNARMQPLGVIFNKFPRIIRDLSRQLKKEIDLILEGNDVDLDKSVVETLSDPLIHLIRNCADHGIETPEERLAAGKKRKGTVLLKAYHKGGQVFIDIADDGRGMDADQLKQKVIEKNLFTVEKLAHMTQQEIYKLIFLPGFSIKDEVSEISGRGVGMDVVKTNIEKLGGNIDISSELGEGTTLTLKLPLTLAIIPSQIVDVSGERYAVPQVNLEEMVQAGGKQSKYQIENINGKDILRLRGKLLPLIDLYEILNMEQHSRFNSKLFEEKEAEGSDIINRKQEIRNILILTAGVNRFGLVVSSLLDSEEIVVKPLSSFIKTCQYYAGATILGDGKVAMILDVAGLAKTAELQFRDIAEEEKIREQKTSDKGAKDIAPFLVFQSAQDDRFAVPLQLISRVDKIEKSDLITVEGKVFYKHHGVLIRLIWLHEYLSVNAPDQDIESEYIYVIVPKLVPHTIGICATSIQDIVESNIELNTRDMSESGIIGTAVINDRAIMFIDIFELFEIASPDQYKTKYSGLTEFPDSAVIAESNPIHLRMLEKYIRSYNIKPFLAKDGLEAFKKVQSTKSRIVFTTPDLPVLDGKTLINQIRSLENGEGVKFIALTELASDKEKNKQLETNYDTFVQKYDKYGLFNSLEDILTEKSEAAQ